MKLIKNSWNYLSHLGVDQDEIHSKREIILLNKMIVIACTLVLLFVPLEIILNGFELVPYELISVLIYSSVLFFNKFKYHSIAKHVTIIAGTGLILFSTIAVGGHSNSEFSLLPIMLLPIIFYKNLKQILPITLMVILVFYWIVFKIDTVTPLVEIPMELRKTIQPILTFMTIVFLFFELYYFKNLNLDYELMLEKQKEEITKSHYQLEQHHKEIQDSINYAKRIQDAIMPSLEAMHQTLGNCFVLYLPKDIVAGDFFWMETVDFDSDQSTIYFAAADCTGHGVPGAMVSVVCCNALSKALLEEGIRDTGKLLDKTRDLVITQLAKGGEEVKDGMDISLCRLQVRKLESSQVDKPYNYITELQWSGANNSLWILTNCQSELVKNTNCQSEFVEDSNNSSWSIIREPQIKNPTILEIKPDKQPIGKSIDPQPFKSHTIQLNEGDSFYLFTDGYQDQFGGPKGKKFKASQLKEMLVSSGNSTMLEQRILIENTFDIWKNELEQVDDVCIIGVRV